jgi:hypothetical protein
MVVFIPFPPMCTVSEDLDRPQRLIGSNINGNDVSNLAIAVRKVFDSVVDNRINS